MKGSAALESLDVTPLGTRSTGRAVERGNDSMFAKQHTVHVLKGRKYESKEKEIV